MSVQRVTITTYAPALTGSVSRVTLVSQSVTGPTGSSGTGGDMMKADNLAGLTNLATARTNLGLGTAATTAASAYATAAQGATADTALQVGGTAVVGHIPTVTDDSPLTVEWAAPSGGGGSSLPVQPLSGDSSYSGTPGVHIYTPESFTWASVVADRAVWGFFVVTTQMTLSAAEIRVTVAGAGGSLARVGVYTCTAALQPGSLVADFGAVAADSTGRKTITGLSTVLAPGFYFSVVVASASFSVECHGGYSPWWSAHPVATNNPLTGYTGTVFTYGALPGSVAAITSGNFRHAPEGTIVPVTFKWS